VKGFVMNRFNPGRRATLSALLATPFLSLKVQAQGSDWPNRPVRVVVPWPPGGGADTTARMIFPKLAQKLGQPFVIENRPGASGSIGAAEVARSAPDGYTLLHDATPLAINPFLLRVSFDALVDLKAVFLPMKVPMLLVMNPAQAPKSLAEVIALAKARPGSLDWASSGNGSAQHLALELFTRAAGITVNHVPYRGGGPALTGQAHPPQPSALRPRQHCRSSSSSSSCPLPPPDRGNGHLLRPQSTSPSGPPP
jgi:tripartite-type tricarboxylate transporter receptor subunit TctC